MNTIDLDNETFLENTSEINTIDNDNTDNNTDYSGIINNNFINMIQIPIEQGNILYNINYLIKENLDDDEMPPLINPDGSIYYTDDDVTDDEIPPLINPEENVTDDEMPPLINSEEDVTDDEMPQLINPEEDVTDDEMPQLINQDGSIYQTDDDVTDDEMPPLINPDGSIYINENHTFPIISGEYISNDMILEDIVTEYNNTNIPSIESTDTNESGDSSISDEDKRNKIKKTIPIMNMDGTITTVYDRDILIKESNKNKSLPYRLVMIETVNNCQFCDTPTGPSYTHNINYHNGFISCKNCKQKGIEALKEWYDTLAFGRVNHLKDKNIKIRRSNVNPLTGTDIEDGWRLNNPIIMIKNNIEYVECVNDATVLERYCMVDTILELN